MGASPSSSSTGMMSKDATGQAVSSYSVPAPENDFTRQIRDYAVSRLTGSSGLRMAGDKLTDLEPSVSMAEEAAAMKYSPEKTTKAPGSQYLAYSSSPARVTGA
jgi:hypothetical protein